MPYQNLSDLPEAVSRRLPEEGQCLYRDAFNREIERLRSVDADLGLDEKRSLAHSAAWRAVRQQFAPPGHDVDGDWRRVNADA